MRFRRSLMVGFIAVVMFVTGSGTANAVTTTWTAHWKYKLYSRTYSAHAGNISMVLKRSCSGSSSFLVELEQVWGDRDFVRSVGTRRIFCGTASQGFGNQPAGTYDFVLTKDNDGVYWNASGTITYA